LDLLGPRRAFTEPTSTSDALVVTPRHARAASVPSSRFPLSPSLRLASPDCPGSRRTSLRRTGKGTPGESPRTPSVVSSLCEPKPAERTCAYPFGVSACPRTVSPSLGASPASGGASCFLPASVLVPPRALASSRRRRRAMRLTDFCHLNDARAPVPRELLAPTAAFTAWTLTESWAPFGRPGNRVFHDTRERFGGSSWSRAAYAPFRDPVRNARKRTERGRFIPTAPTAIEPMTPLSPLPLAGTSDRLRAPFQLSLFRSRKPPRSP
jgi:hypothetical protein